MVFSVAKIHNGVLTREALKSMDCLQECLGGYLEMLPTMPLGSSPKFCGFCDEEGLLKNLYRNDFAVEVLSKAFGVKFFCVVHGPVLVLSTKRNGEECSLENSDWEAIVRAAAEL